MRLTNYTPNNTRTHKMADDQQFCLRWNEFQSNMVSSFKHLREEKSFTDVTLACDGQTCKAHKMVLSACSPYFKALLEENPSKHPIIILKDVPYSHLQAILEVWLRSTKMSGKIAEAPPRSGEAWETGRLRSQSHCLLHYNLPSAPDFLPPPPCCSALQNTLATATLPGPIIPHQPCKLN
ncbi:hypothetical protein Pmani_004463 [Petrolisthes manimaculis]|uniref:BTB domain-containing protein n=1 Tax=Petrolisthes manimaculis TaxID=1843537 RepID=A0AAE1QGU0_9EUCA|nr:hypothetical protein Pmani_004463 [Petrolisthes manimaculis]